MNTPTAQAPAARVERLSKIYGDGPTRVTALDQVSLEIGSRSFTAIMGPSGSGKSTLMHCMAGPPAGRSKRCSPDGQAVPRPARGRS